MNRKNKKREKNEPARKENVCDRYILRPQVRISSQSRQVSEKSESSTEEFSV